MRNSMGAFTPLAIPSEVLAASPKPVQQLWAKVTAAHKRYNEARDVLVVMEEQAKSAPELDEIAAREAVAQDQPVPASTIPATLDAINNKQREIRALAEHADDEEANFLNALNGSRPDMAAGFRADSERFLSDAIAALDAALIAVERFAMSAALWNWARHGDDRVPPHQGFKVPVHGGGTVHDLIERSIVALGNEHPDEIEEAERQYKFEMAQLVGRTTPDGLLKDRAAFAAYER